MCNHWLYNCIIISYINIQYVSLYQSRILKQTRKTSHVWCYVALCLMNLTVEACTVVRHLCFLQESAAEHGCGVVLWFVTSEAPLTTNRLHCIVSITKTEKYKYTLWHVSSLRASVPLCASTARRCCLFWPLPFQFHCAHEELMKRQTCRNQSFPADLYCILTRLKCNQKGMLKGFLCFVLVCVCTCVCVHIQLCGGKKKLYPWRLSFRFDQSDEICGEGRPEGFSVSERSEKLRFRL